MATVLLGSMPLRREPRGLASTSYRSRPTPPAPEALGPDGGESRYGGTLVVREQT
jgi:hypothetical protein